MQRLFFVVLICSNLLFIQGQRGPASSPTKTGKGYSVDELYKEHILKIRAMRSACQTEECKLDELIAKFSRESQTTPPIAPEQRPSNLFGGVLDFLLQKKKDLIGQIVGVSG